MTTPNTADTDPRPWDRQPGESPAAWAAFQVYRDAGRGRSLAKTGATLGRTRNAVGLHSARWRWLERAAAFDAWLDRHGQTAAADAVEAMNKRHAEAASDALAAIVERLKTLDPSELAPRDIAPLLKAAADLERKARGADGPTGTEDDPANVRHVIEYVNDWRGARPGQG